MQTKRRPLPGRLGEVEFDRELPTRRDVEPVFDELDYQMAWQAYLWALPLVSYAHWRTEHYELFGATGSDLVHYVSYRDRLGLHHSERDHAVHPQLLRDRSARSAFARSIPTRSVRGRSSTRSGSTRTRNITTRRRRE